LKVVPISSRVPAESRNEAASTHSTCWTDATVMSSPASSGPAIWAADQLAWTRPLAATRSSSEGTRLGMAANWAASKAIVSVALAKATAYTQPTVSASTAASSGMVAITAARARSVAIIRRLRSTRSTQAPMTSPNNR
jgi:hypothetical protein